MQLNPSKPFLGMFATLVLLYIVYLLLSTSPLDRLNRICTPLTLWPGRVVVAGTDIFAEDYSPKVDDAFYGAFDVCRQWSWNVFYARDYARLQAENAETKPATAETTGVVNSPGVEPSSRPNGSGGEPGGSPGA